MQIAIDGPSGSGKSTIAKLIAKELGIVYIDTGAMYRAVGYYAQNNGISTDDEAALFNAMKNIDIHIKYIENAQHIILNGQDITIEVRTAQAGVNASAVARFEGVRAGVVGIIKRVAGAQSVIMDGRDIGTVVLPNAAHKFFLTASADARTKRRVHELAELGQPADYDSIKAQIIARDEQDTNRAQSPLKQADDAVLIDTSQMTIDEVVNAVLKLINGLEEK